MARGIEDPNIFADDRDRYDFINQLGAIVEETGTNCFALALISNHFHLLLRTGSVSIFTVMRRFLTGHATRYNRRHRRNEHPFQNGFKSAFCQEDNDFPELVRYIHLNPLRAKLVKLHPLPTCFYKIIIDLNFSRNRRLARDRDKVRNYPQSLPLWGLQEE